MFISLSLAWRIFSCITREGACAIELEDLWSDAGSRCARGSTTRDPIVFANFSTAITVCIYIRPSHGRQRLHAVVLQEPAAAGHHRDQYGVHRNLGGGDAADCRVSVDARD